MEKKTSRLINLGSKSDVVPLEKGLFDITDAPMAYSKKKGKKKKVWGEYATWMDRGLGPKGIKMKDVPGWDRIKGFNEWKSEVVENALKESVNNGVVYHTTDSSRIASIMRHGLKVDSMPNYSRSSLEYMESVYGMVPIFVSFTEEPYVVSDESVMLEIDAFGLQMVADIPSLADRGAYIEQDGIWFKGKNIIDPVNDPDIITYEELLDPFDPYCKRAIEITGTAAILEDISPERIRVI